jgi:hypothetical protein
MSGHLRFCFAAFVLLAGLPSSPASSNPLAEFVNAVPRQATAPASAEGECLRSPARRRRPASTGSIVWKATANAGFRPLRGARGRRNRFLIGPRSLASPIPRRTRPRGDSGRRSWMRMPSCCAPHGRRPLSRCGPLPSSTWLMPLPSSLRGVRPSCQRVRRKLRDRSAHARSPHAAPGRRKDASGSRTGGQLRGCRFRASGRAGRLSHRRGGR